jgi:DNA-binding PadR family transcriptional regulator
MTSPPTATSFALLGLLGIQPWTAYELVGQANRSLHFIWPRSEAHLYAELKRLVARGHANAELVDGLRRQRTRYTITAEGRAALKEWLSTEPAPPTVEVEGFLRMFLGDQGGCDDLRAALESTARQARALNAQGKALIEEHLDTGGPFPQRVHLVEPIAHFYEGFFRLLIGWCDETIAEIDTWPDTKDLGMTPRVRQRYSAMIDRPDP